jgi:putative resolvase
LTCIQLCAKMRIMNTYNVSEFAELIGVSVNTLQRWDREKRLEALRTPTNRRIYTDDHLSLILSQRSRQDRITVCYARVSSTSQKPDLENQVSVLEQFCIGAGISVDEWTKEIGGGLNFKRKKFLRIVDQIILGRVEKLIIAHKDRFTRFGFELVEHLCHIHDTELVILNNEKLSPEQEMIEDVMAILHCFSARLYGLRNYRKSLKKALNDQGAQDKA